jgi:hypothetical protein
MKPAALILLLLWFAVTACAEETIAPGTALPVTLDRTLDVGKVHVGETVVVKISQDVPLGPSTRLRSGTRIHGQVVEAHTQGKKGASALTLRFDQVLTQTPIRVSTSLRAIASPLEVDDAQLPEYGPDRGTSPASYTTTLVGGDVVYRGGGPVMHADEVVGEPVFDGVLVHLMPNRERDCPAEAGGTTAVQATSVFGSHACGAYGFSDLQIAHWGRTEPVGQITFRSEKKPIKLRAGTALLLRITAADDAATPPAKH